MPKTFKMVKTAALRDAQHMKSLSKGNNASAYAVWLRLTMLQIHLYQYWTVAETQLKRRSAPRPSMSTMCRQSVRPNYY